jgi:response regulator RpfG family c-di-GMP phosphodiesterase
MDASLAHIDQTKVVTKKDVDALTPSDRQLVFNHPLKTVELINEIPEIPQDVKNIILAHHERPDGSGFPKSLDSTNLSPLSSAFILAHEFSHRLLAHPKTKESLMKTVTDFQQYYSTNNFKKPYQAFINVFRLKK